MKKCKNYRFTRFLPFSLALSFLLTPCSALDFCSNALTKDSNTILSEQDASNIQEGIYLPCDIELLDAKVNEQLRQQEILDRELRSEAALKNGIAKSLKGEMSGQESLFYDYSIELNLDPVFVTALASWETGYGSSNICVNKHNFGGMRSKGEWIRFSSKTVGIEAFINLLSSYKAKGLITPDQMVAKYAENSESWVAGVRGIMKNIQANIDVELQLLEQAN